MIIILFIRPSSRGANSDYYPIYEDPNVSHMPRNTGYRQIIYQQLPPDQQQLSSLDPARLEVFRKNWEYYKMWNPQVNFHVILVCPNSELFLDYV